ncbi:MAG: hypothetical protein AAGH90_04110 [Pseudomonadota bacterium]
MFDRAGLRAAVGANVITAAQASRLEAFLISRLDGDERPVAGQENLRFLANFNDIFITLGLIILFIGLTTFVSMVATPSVASGHILSGIVAALVIGGAAWGMLEYFAGRRRLLLPSMALTLMFCMFVTFGLTALYGSSVIGADFIETIDADDVFQLSGNLGIVACLSSFLAAALVFLRFRLPFSLAVMAISLSGAVYTFLSFYGGLGLILGGTAFLLLGILTFLAAVFFDMQDPERIRKPSDHAFWLHLTAAPQIIAGVSTIVTGSNILMGSTSGTDNSAQSLTLLGVLLLIGIVSLAINRRALIAASLITFIFGLSFVLSEVGLDASNIFIMVTIIIGSGVVLLGAGWKTARRAVLVFFPKGGTWNRVFPAEPA